MHSTLTRAQNVFGFFTTVAFTIMALLAASDLVTPRAPSASVKLRDVQVYVSSSLALSFPYPAPL
jgi:hypothetical protein